MDAENDKFEYDFAVILHEHSQKLIGISEWLEPVVEYFGKDPFVGHGEITQLEIEQSLYEPIKKLHKSINNIFLKIGDDWLTRNIPVSFKDTLEEIQITLKKYIDSSWGKKYRPPYIHAQLTSVIELCDRNKNVKIGKEQMRHLIQDTKSVQKILCLYDLRNALIKIHEMENQTKELREFYSDSIHPQVHKDIIPLSDVVRSAIREQGVYAHAKRIELRLSDNSSSEKIICDRRLITRAISNVINNAIKYNYVLRCGEVWVQIDINVDDDFITLSVENWGVPITADEIESGSIYKPGVRGSYAKAKGETGNGIGLADVKKTIQMFNGYISIKSIPANKWEDKVDYSKPFLTTIEIRFPRVKKGS